MQDLQIQHGQFHFRTNVVFVAIFDHNECPLLAGSPSVPVSNGGDGDSKLNLAIRHTTQVFEFRVHTGHGQCRLQEANILDGVRVDPE